MRYEETGLNGATNVPPGPALKASSNSRSALRSKNAESVKSFRNPVRVAFVRMATTTYSGLRPRVSKQTLDWNSPTLSALKTLGWIRERFQRYSKRRTIELTTRHPRR
jgi:hypothetical protein